MKNAIRRIAYIFFALVFVFGAVNTVFAASTADAKEKIDTAKNCSLTLTYAVDGKKISGLEIEAYMAASVTSDFVYSMYGGFSGYAIELNGIKSQNEWNEVRDTVGAYITADGIQPDSVQFTDENGMVRFDPLKPGIYYIRWTGNENADNVSGFAPFLIAVPGLGDDGLWIYDVDALPKPGKLPEPVGSELKIVKLWNDGTQASKRPQSVDVDIFKNGEKFESVTLDAENNWTFVLADSEDCAWTAVERNVPDGYTVTIQNNEKTIQITNTLKDEPEPPPKTGDTGKLSLWIILTLSAGMILVVLGSRRRKSINE